MITGKCPYCKQPVVSVLLEGIAINQEAGGGSYHGVSYLCPACRSVLGVGIDPVALMEDTIKGVKRQGKT